MNDIIDEFDEVLLKDGCKGAVVEVLGDQELFMVDVGSSPLDWETITVKRDDIIKILRKSK